MEDRLLTRAAPKLMFDRYLRAAKSKTCAHFDSSFRR